MYIVYGIVRNIINWLDKIKNIKKIISFRCGINNYGNY